VRHKQRIEERGHGSLRDKKNEVCGRRIATPFKTGVLGTSKQWKDERERIISLFFSSDDRRDDNEK